MYFQMMIPKYKTSQCYFLSHGTHNNTLNNYPASEDDSGWTQEVRKEVPSTAAPNRQYLTRDIGLLK